MNKVIFQDLAPLRATLGIVFTLICAGCGSCFAPDRTIRDRLDDNAVVGTWQLTAESLKLLTRDGIHIIPNHRYPIVFRSDHTCEFDSVLESARGVSHLSTRCSWELHHDVGEERKANELRIALPTPTGLHAHNLDFTRDDGRLILWIYYGDPDLWEFIEYERTP